MTDRTLPDPPLEVDRPRLGRPRAELTWRRYIDSLAAAAHHYQSEAGQYLAALGDRS